MVNGYESMETEESHEDAGERNQQVSSANASEDNTSSQPPATTTIGTIALKSGDTRLVIALLQNGEWLRLKVLEIQPELTKLGSSPEEATELSNAHDEVLLRLQSKQSPVEELLRQADRLISTQRLKAEVYKAMAETLANAWRDVNSLLERRKQILDRNVLFQCRAEECKESMRALEMACNDTLLPIEIEAVKNFLGKIHDLRKVMLEAVMGALQEGKILLDRLKEISNEGTLDSRPDKIKADADYAILQVETWLEELHDRRRLIEVSFKSRKTQLEQCLALALLATDLRELEDILNIRITALSSTSDHLGDSSASAELLLFECKKLQNEAKDFQDRAIRITKSTERLVSSGHFAGEQATEQAYAILGAAADYINDLDQYKTLLNRAVAFFEAARSALTKMDQLEIQLVTTEHSPHSPAFARLHAQVVETLEDITREPLAEGHALLEITGRGAPGAEGVKRMVEDIEDRKIRLLENCTAHREENVRVSQCLHDFFEKYRNLRSWLSSIVESFLRGHQDMGSDLRMAKDFYQLHCQLLNDLEKKSFEVQMIDQNISQADMHSHLEKSEQRDIDEKMKELRNAWLVSKKSLEARIQLGSLYADFHQAATNLENELNSLEADLKNNADNLDDEKMAQLEQRWRTLQPYYLRLTATGKAFLDEGEKINDAYLDVPRACLCVETTLERFSNRQFTVTKTWENWQNTITILKERLVEREKKLEESTRTLEWVAKFREQLYPIITSESTKSSTILRDLESSRSRILPELNKAVSELDARIKGIDAFEHRGDDITDQLIRKQLSQVSEHLQSTALDYQTLLESLISVFENLTENELKTDQQIQTQDIFHLTNLPKEAVREVKTQLQRHEIELSSCTESLARVRSEMENVIPRIERQEPPEAARQDIQKIKQAVNNVTTSWESSWTNEKLRLEYDLQFSLLREDLEKIDKEIQELSKQLRTISCWLGENLSSAKAASESFNHFEKSLEIIRDKLESFIEISEEKLPKESSLIQHEIESLREKLKKLKMQADDTRKRINSSIEYFELLDETKDWFKEGSKLLIIIARKTSTVKEPQEAIDLLADIEKFLKPGEDKQEKRIERIRELSTQVFGTDRLPQFNEVVVENREMLDSFAVVSSELRTLAENLRNAADLREKLKKEQDEADAKLEEAKKEANAAQAAAAQAENARKIAERLTAETLEKAAEEAKRLTKLEAEAEKERERNRQVAVSAQTEKTNLLDERLVKETIMKETSSVTTKEIHILQKSEIMETIPIQIQPILEQEPTIVKEEIIKEEINLKPTSDNEQKISEHQSLNIPVSMAPQFTVSLNDATIQEGEKLTFECHLIGSPEPEVYWYKDGISIINNPDYFTSYKEGICTLTIEETFTEDSARFTCKASNDLGLAETEAILTVKETAPEEQPSSPHFIKELQSSVANEGSTHRLECFVEGNPLPTVMWFKNDINIDNCPNYIINYNNGGAVLEFEEVFLDDQATYSCKATNCLGEASTCCSLAVKSPQDVAAPLTEKPQIISSPSNIMARTGEKVKLECEATGNPTPTLIWTHDGNPIEDTSTLKIHTDGGRTSLVISEAFPKDAGSYVVIVRNSAGEVTASCNVSVKGRLPTNETSDSEHLCSDMKPIVPSIRLPLKDIQIKEGESARLDCIIIGHPEPEVIWYHDERPVKESADFQLLFQGDRCSLVIHEAFLDDAGLYKVVAINSSGEASSNCILSVKPRGFKDTPESTPVFVKLLTDLLVAEGEESVFDCVITGEPKPEIRWYLNGDEIVENDRIKITKEENGTNILRISSTLPEDKGNYIAKATNHLGEAKAFARLVVRVLGDFQKKDELVRMEEKLVAPSFKERFESKSVFEGAPIKFECIVTGKPAPKIQWLFNERPVHGKDFLVSVSGERQVLTIPEAVKAHTGTVSCVAENAAGKAICSGKVEVGVGVREEGLEIVQVPNDKMHASSSSEKHFTTEKTSGEGGSESQVLTKMSSTITESSTSHSSTKKEFVSSTCSSTLGTLPGHVPANLCVKKTTQSSENAFSQNGAPPVVQCHRVEEFEKIFQDVPGEVKQERTVIITEDTELTKHVCKPCRKQTAPRFVSPVTGMIVDQGTDVVLEGIVDGFPQPKISWAKNNQEIRTKDGIKMIYAQNHARLELKNVNVKDAGRYTCTAFNDLGNASSTADLVVKKTIFPPVFGRRLQAQVVKRGDRVIMEVEITGTPEPTVTWYKDDFPLRERPPEIRMKQQGCCYLLLIEKAEKTHAGKYMVHATNAGGEAQSIADFAVFEPTPDTMIEFHKTLVYENVQDKDVVEPDEKKAKIPSANLTTQHITTTMIQPSAAIKTPIPPTSSCSTIRTIQSETSGDTKATRSEMISSTTESHRSETKSEQKFHMKLEHKAAPLFENASGDLEYVKPSKESKTTIETTKEEMTSGGKLVEREIKTFDEQATQIENENVETSTVAKKDALSFFEAMSKGSESRPKGPKDMITLTEGQVGTGPGCDVKVGKLTKNYERTTRFEEAVKEPVKEPVKTDFKTSKKAVQDIFSKFEQSSSSRGIDNNLIEFPYEGYKLPPLEIKRTILEDVTASGSPIHGTLTISKLEAQSESAEAMLKGFNLVPEPPPEIGYAPAEVAKKKRPDVSIKAKQLQESFDKGLSPVDAPYGGVKLFPSSPVPKPEPKFTTRPTCATERPLSIPPPFELGKKEVIEETCTKKNVHQEQKKTTGSDFNKTYDSSSSMMRSVSPYKEITKEKFTSSSSDYDNRSHVSTDISEYRCHSVASSDRPTSPKPSTDALRMEKSWAHKSESEANRKSWPPPRETTRTFTDRQEWQVPEQDFKLTTKETTKDVEVTPAGRSATTNIESTTSIEKKSWASQENRFVEKIIEQPPPPKPEPKPIIYKAETTKVDHTISTVQEKSITEKYTTECDVHKTQTTEKMIEAIEQRSTKPCPASTDLKAPSLVKSVDTKKTAVQFYHKNPEPILQPGPPPEIGYAPGPVVRENKIEKIEKTLEMSLEHQPARILPGAVRTIPPPIRTTKKKEDYSPPLPPKDLRITPPPIPTRQQLLEPFPYQPTPLSVQKTTPTLPHSCTPTKFVKTSFYSESDYESDMDGGIRSKWCPCESDNDEPRYRKVTAPTPTQPRPKSTEPEPLPPSSFELPSSEFTGPPRPFVTSEFQQDKTMKKTMTRHERDFKQQQQRCSQTFQSPPVLPKPGSPPIYVQPTSTFAQRSPPSKPIMPESPKFKTKTFQQESGYMADTDEPFQYLQQQQQQKTCNTSSSGQKAFSKHEESSLTSKSFSESKSSYSESRSNFMESKNYSSMQISESSKPPPCTQFVPKTQVQRTSYIEKSSASTTFPTKETIHSVNRTEQWKSVPQPGQKIQPPPSPSKFVKGEFRESDYESDFDNRISTHWKPRGPDTTDHTSKSAKPNVAGTGSPWPYSNGVPAGKEVIQPYLEPQPKKAPLFITPLRDIAVVSGQTARFECIVQAEPQPNILWSKNGRIIENSANYEVYYRNGVCRLTLPRAFPDDAGTYACTATNSLGSAGTTSTLQVPGNRRSVYTIN
ncbi:titin isoform X2 [Belonocnema kinseyi]|uniref:titin isoform X2 n=1 Tax=Belonocnema kinseyi TaxID=2817044 RepID=UPI00143DB9AD|nr:titin isoform X2 [Belonocnema kinseyi]